MNSTRRILGLTIVLLCGVLLASTALAGSSLVAGKRKLSQLSGDNLGLAGGNLFGSGVAALDVNHDNIMDLAVGGRGTAGGGAVWVLIMRADGTVQSVHEISSATPQLVGLIHADDDFGRSVAAIGDVDGDGIPDLAIGAPNDDAVDADDDHIDDGGGINRGAIYIVTLTSLGGVGNADKIDDTDAGLVIPNNSDQFGFSIAALGDLDGAGGSQFALAVGAKGDRDGGTTRGAVHVLFMHSSGPSFAIDADQKISDTQGTPVGFTLHTLDLFGSSVSAVDLNGDAIPDLAVGAPNDDDGGAVGVNRGAVYIMNLASNGTVSAFQKITGTLGGFTGSLDDLDFLGDAVAWVPDLDGDGVPDLAVGATGDDDGFSAAGAAWVLLMHPDGTVRRKLKISETVSPLGALHLDDNFGASLASMGDVNLDGVPDLAAGAPGDDDGGGSTGAAYRLLLGRTSSALSMLGTHCGEDLVITVTLSPASATGTVELFEGVTSLGTAALASGHASFTLPPRAVGSYSGFTARYYGDDNDLESTSPAFTAVVSLVATVTSLLSNANPVSCQAAVTLTANVSGTNPTGSVTFLDGVSPLGTAPIVAGQAALSTSFSTSGPHEITASYSGDACFEASVSGPLALDVDFNTIQSTADPGGSVSPAVASVGCGGEQKVTITPDPCYAIANVSVDGNSVGPVASYTFTNVQGNHTLYAQFAPLGPYPIFATSGTGGSVIGPGEAPCGSDQKVTITPDLCFDIQDVTVDGVSVGPVASYSFTNVQTGHTVDATFMAVGPLTITSSATPGGTITPSGPTPVSCGGERKFEIQPDHGFVIALVLVDGLPAPVPGGSDYWSYTFTGVTANHTIDVMFDISLATVIERVDAEPVADGLRLTWRMANPSLLSEVSIERADHDAGPWSVVPAETRVEDGGVVAVDRGVEPARSYWYRLVVTAASGAQAVFGPVSATSAAPREFALGAVWPNPTRGPLRLMFTVAREAPVRLSLVDVQGREVEVLASGVYAAGRYQLSWDGRVHGGEPAPAGLYFVRYECPGATRVQRLVLAR